MNLHLTFPQAMGALGLLTLIALAINYWRLADLRRKLAADRAAWRIEIARGLMDAATATAEVSESAAAALTSVAEALQGTGEMGFLESRVLRERVQAGAKADESRSSAHLHMRIAGTLLCIAGARELINVMLPDTRRDKTLRDDALGALDAASATCKGLTTPTTNLIQ